MRVKKCASCNHGLFRILFDSTIQLVCASCGQVYRAEVLKRLPDDLEATQSIKISVTNSSNLVQLN